jgi:hypothetical protein
LPGSIKVLGGGITGRRLLPPRGEKQKTPENELKDLVRARSCFTWKIVEQTVGRNGIAALLRGSQ